MEMIIPHFERLSKESEANQCLGSKIKINVRLSRNERRVATTKLSSEKTDPLLSGQLKLDEILKPTRHSSLNYGKNDKYTSFNYFLKKVSRPQRDNHDQLQFIQRNVLENDTKEILSHSNNNEVNLVSSPSSPTKFKIKTKSRESKAAAFQWVLTKNISSKKSEEKFKDEEGNFNSDSYSGGEPSSVRKNKREKNKGKKKDFVIFKEN